MKNNGLRYTFFFREHERRYLEECWNLLAPDINSMEYKYCGSITGFKYFVKFKQVCDNWKLNNDRIFIFLFNPAPNHNTHMPAGTHLIVWSLATLFGSH